MATNCAKRSPDGHRREAQAPVIYRRARKRRAG
jgi:hypothetical protein